MSDSISAIESTATAMISASGARTSGGLSRIAPASRPNATTSRSAIAIATPIMTPRREKRALSVTTGMASQERVATWGPPVSATAPAIIASEPTQAANITYSGRSDSGRWASATRKNPAATASGSNVHQPIQGAPATSAIAKTPMAMRRTGLMRSSISSRRSRSKSSLHSQLPDMTHGSVRPTRLRP